MHPEIFPVNKLSNLNYFIKKTIITAIFILAVSFGTFTQTKGEVDVSVELGFGSEIGYDFNFKYPQIFVTPQYNVTENFWAGGGVGFLYHYHRELKNTPEYDIFVFPVYAATGYRLNLGKILSVRKFKSRLWCSK